MNDIKFNKKKFPLISIVMLNYNGLNYLKKTITPILNLDYSNYEFIIVDNGSTDGSIEFIKKFKKIKLIKSPRLREKNFACNYAIKRAKGKYILLMDNDALIIDSNLIQNLYYESKLAPLFGSFTVAYTDIKSNLLSVGGYLDYFISKINLPKYFLKNKRKLHLSKISNPSGIMVFIKKDMWVKVKGYDETFPFGCDDKDLGIKIMLEGYFNYLYSKKTIIHLGEQNRTDNKKYVWKYGYIIAADLFLVVKNYSFFNMLITLICYSIFAFAKSIKQSIQRIHPGPFIAFFKGYYLFLTNLPVALKKRKEIQSKRVIKEDIFLKIKPSRVD